MYAEWRRALVFGKFVGMEWDEVVLFDGGEAGRAHGKSRTWKRLRGRASADCARW